MTNCFIPVRAIFVPPARWDGDSRRSESNARCLIERWCFTGDGGFTTISLNWKPRGSQHQPVTVVTANSALNQEIRLNDIAYGGRQRGRSEEMWRFPEVNFVKVAEAFGCVGLRVEDPRELNATIKKAIALNKPVVIDAVSDMYAIADKPWTPDGAPDFHSFQKAPA